MQLTFIDKKSSTWYNSLNVLLTIISDWSFSGNKSCIESNIIVEWASAWESSGFNHRLTAFWISSKFLLRIEDEQHYTGNQDFKRINYLNKSSMLETSLLSNNTFGFGWTFSCEHNTRKHKALAIRWRISLSQFELPECTLPCMINNFMLASCPK